jgi:hypothetical protein
MKNMIRLSLAILLVQGLITSTAHAEPPAFSHAAPPAWGVESCFNVEIEISPKCAKAGEMVTLSGRIKNCSRREVVKATIDIVGLLEFEKKEHFKPKLTAPPGREEVQEFNYSAKVLDTVLDDDYYITLSAEGEKSGIEKSATATLKVGKCGAIVRLPW